MTSTPAPTPEAVADALTVAEMGGDLSRLAAVCLDRAEQHQGEGRQRLLDAAAAMRWTASLLALLDGPEPDGAGHAEG